MTGGERERERGPGGAAPAGGGRGPGGAAPAGGGHGLRARLPRTPRGRFAAGLAAVVVLFAAAIAILDRLAPAPQGPKSSSFATAPEGLAAYADLLRRAGHPVERRRRDLAGDRLSPERTLVVLDPRAVPPEEARAIGAFVRAGGRLVAGGTSGTAWLEGALGEAPEPGDERDGDARALVPVPETAGVATVGGPGLAGWERAGSALPVLGPPEAPLAVLAVRGAGRALLLASAAPLQNPGLQRADNAALALAAAGPAERPVVFLETVHGYGAATGLAALPADARWMLAGLLLAGLLFAWSHARRLGPPEEEERPLPPPRADYVDALAGALVRTKRPAEVAGPLRAAARERLARRAGLPAGAGDGALREAAERFGLPADETAALLEAPTDLDGALAAGRAHARLGDAVAAGRAHARPGEELRR